MLLKVLSSGSKGNCYIIDSPSGSLLIEAGIPWRLIQRGLDFNLSGVIGCLISHAHGDHSMSVKDVVKAGIDTYATEDTFDFIDISNHRTKVIEPLKQFNIGDYIIMPFPTEHDIQGSTGFLIQYKPTGEKLLFLTDSYYSKYTFNGLNYIMVECNYAKETLDENISAGRIDMSMKPRLIKSHFSLENVISFLRANDLSLCTEIVLLHLSDANSDAQMMLDRIYAATGILPKVADAGLIVPFEKDPY